MSGTKGKGSTCAMCESILNFHGYKTGFFSSPHLVSVRERIRINHSPLSEIDFSLFFWSVYNKLYSQKVILIRLSILVFKNVQISNIYFCKCCQQIAMFLVLNDYINTCLFKVGPILPLLSTSNDRLE